MSSRSLDAEVAVVGAGPVGSTVAMMLARSGKGVLVLDKADFPRDKPCGEGLMPAGAAILHDLGIDLRSEGFPTTRGVRYRLPDGTSAFGAFKAGTCGFGVRRLRLDTLLAERAGRVPGVELRLRTAVTGIVPGRERVILETSQGSIAAGAVVAADGIRSLVRRRLGWSLPARPPHRVALVGHLEVPAHGLDEVVVSLLGDHEVYFAPSASDEVLAVVLGSREGLQSSGRTASEHYRVVVDAAMPEWAGAPFGRVLGAGPFRVAARTVAEGRVFLAGDATGFIDPLTGDAMSAGLVGARQLALLLAADPSHAAASYRRWYARQWRTRRAVTWVALTLTTHRRLARRALAGMRRRPTSLEALMEVNEGRRGLSGLGLRDLAAVAGI